MSKGIYQYTDLETGDIVYIGKDSDISINRRHKHHLRPSNYDEQPINRILQNNLNRYEYGVFVEGNFTPNLLCWLEKKYIAKYNSKFNFTEGGDGLSGFKHSEETKQKISVSRSMSTNTSGYLHVSKQQCKRCKQGFLWRYRYTEDGKGKSILSVSLEKLEEKVRSKGLEWRKL